MTEERRISSWGSGTSTWSRGSGKRWCCTTPRSPATTYPVRDPEESWRRRREQYVGWLEGGEAGSSSSPARGPRGCRSATRSCGSARPARPGTSATRVGDLESLSVTAAARGTGDRDRADRPLPGAPARALGAQVVVGLGRQRQRGRDRPLRARGLPPLLADDDRPDRVEAPDLKEFAPVEAHLNPELTELSLDQLRLRRSAKWRYFDEDVLPAFVAEMDFPLAPPVKIALAEAVELDDTGYGYPAGARARRGLRRVRRGALRLGGRPGPRLRRPRRRQRDHLAAAQDRQAGRQGDHQHPRLPPLLHGDRGARAGARRSAAGRRAARRRRDRRPVPRRRRRPDPLQPPQPDRDAADARGQLAAVAESAAAHGAWVLSDEIHSPLTLPGATHVPFLGVSARRRPSTASPSSPPPRRSTWRASTAPSSSPPPSAPRRSSQASPSPPPTRATSARSPASPPTATAPPGSTT